MKVLVCGGRDFGRIKDIKDDKDVQRAFQEEMFFNRWMRNNFLTATPLEIIQGEAPGADTLARQWAEYWELPCRGFPADWDKHKKAAGFIRNQQMLDEGKPDVVVAFPGGRGTADMVRRARRAGVEVIEVVYP